MLVVLNFYEVFVGVVVFGVVLGLGVRVYCIDCFFFFYLEEDTLLEDRGFVIFIVKFFVYSLVVGI